MRDSSETDEVLVCVAQRLQGQVERQLTLVERLYAAGAEDTLPDLAEMRAALQRSLRGVENLLVLGGAQQGPRGRGPRTVAELLADARAGVDDPARIDLVAAPDAGIASRAANGLLALLTELFTHALAASPGGAPVEVTSLRAEDGGVLVEVAIDDPGPTTGELDELDRRLAGRPIIDDIVSNRVGLFVAARIAARTGAGLRVRSRRLHGHTAVVHCPPALLDPAPLDAVGAGPAPAWRPSPGPGDGYNGNGNGHNGNGNGTNGHAANGYSGNGHGGGGSNGYAGNGYGADDGYGRTGHVDTGYDPGPGTGYDPGYDAGRDTGHDPGPGSGYAAGPDTAYDSGYETGYETGYDPEYDSGYRAGYAGDGYDDPAPDRGVEDTGPHSRAGTTPPPEPRLGDLLQDPLRDPLRRPDPLVDPLPLLPPVAREPSPWDAAPLEPELPLRPVAGPPPEPAFAPYRPPADELFGPLTSAQRDSMLDSGPTPIYEAVASAWFADDDAGSGAAAPEWDAPGDSEWRAATERAARPVPEEETSTAAGLPRRRPGTQMVAPPRRGVAPPTQVSQEREADKVRERLAVYQQGLQRGRHRAGDEDAFDFGR